MFYFGGGTTLVGDPSGKDETRKILDKEQIDHNKKKLKKFLKNLFLSINQKKTLQSLLIIIHGCQI